MKEIEITARSKEEAIQMAIDKYKLPREAMEIIKAEDTTSDMLEGAAPLELRVKMQIKESYLLDLVRNKTSKLLEYMDIDGEVRANIEGNIVMVKLHVNNPSILIGHQGENLNAVQHIINRIVNRGERDLPVIVIDVQNYRVKRLQELENLAKKAAFSVLKYKKKFVLPAMTSEDRKIIHNKIKEFNGVVSYSQGREGERSVVVDLTINSPKKDDKL